MRTLRLLLASLAILLVAGSCTTAFGRDDDKPAKDKADKAAKAEKPEKADKSEKPDKADKADKVDPEHPHGAPPGLMKDPGDPAAPGLPQPPALGKTVGFKPREGGKVKIKLPGSDDWAPLTEGQTVPIGASVDASDGLVEVVVEADKSGERQNAVVFGSVFKVDQFQPAGAAAPVVDLVLKGGDFDSCDERKDDERAVTARAAAASKKRGRAGIVRGLWATAKGRFRTRGRHSAATVRGTRWATVDRCHSTTVKVFEGVVDVMDFNLDRVFEVKAGERHVARGRRN